jgi:hypothetical protein
MENGRRRPLAGARCRQGPWKRCRRRLRGPRCIRTGIPVCASPPALISSAHIRPNHPSTCPAIPAHIPRAQSTKCLVRHPVSSASHTRAIPGLAAACMASRPSFGSSSLPLLVHAPRRGLRVPCGHGGRVSAYTCATADSNQRSPSTHP